MNTSLAIELVGYLASTLIIISIIQKSILRLRLVGLAGSLAFLTYALFIGAYPIAVVNIIAAGIHLWFLRKLIGRKKEVFRILHVLPESRYLLSFLAFYTDEIQGRYQPDFVYEPDDDLVTAFILRDMVPAGVLIGQVQDDGSFKVELDFVIPQYRDFKIGHYVYSPDSALLTGIAPTVVWTEAANDDHAQYLNRIGFDECETQPGRYEIHVSDPVGQHAAPPIGLLGRGEQTL